MAFNERYDAEAHPIEDNWRRRSPYVLPSFVIDLLTLFN